MTQPSISGFLNNCALHVGVPELVLGIRYFAKKESPDSKISVNAELDGCEKSYRQLKTVFEECYQLEKISFQQFHELLTTKVNNNSAAAQAILGPVLRLYMSKIGFDKNKCELQSDGRFATLFSTDAKNVFQNFGINISANELNPDPRFTGTAHRYLKDTPRTIKHEAYKIDIYNEGTNIHWERLPKSEMATAKNDVATLETDTKPIADAFFASSLAMLKAAVQSLISGFVKVAAPKPAVVETKTEEKIIQKISDEARTRYSESLKKRKIEEKPGDAETKKENVRKLVTDLFKVNYDVKSAEVKRTVDESDKAFEKRQQIASDEDLARKLQKDEVLAARGLKL